MLMKNNSRTEKSIRNVIITLLCQLFAMLINFFARKCFIIVLNDEYLGISSLFSTLLTVLSLVELGLAPAMVFSMYEPLAKRDYPTASALMRIYKKSYTVIGCCALAIGWIITPFIHLFVSEMPQNVSHIHLIYMLFVLNTGVSYFFAYKRSLLTADQNQYILDIYHYFIYFLMNVCQIVVLFLTRNYLAFLGLQIFATIVENIIISKRVDRDYPWLETTEPIQLPKEIKQNIIKNVRAMAYHRVGGIVVDSTDNILISRIFGLTTLALYSNYVLISKALSAIVAKIFSALTASVGNLYVTSTKERAFEVFRTTQFINFWIFCFSSICLYVLFNPFIGSCWLGEEYLLPNSTVFIICLNFYVEGMRRSILTFKEAFGLPWYDRHKPLVAALTNLILSIILARLIGLPGIFYGTLCSNLFVNVWWEASVVYRWGFQVKIWSFVRDYFVYFIVFSAIGLLTAIISTYIYSEGILGFILLLFLCLIVPNFFIWMVFRRSTEFKETITIIKNVLKRK